MTDRPGRALGIDFGSRRIGIAISDDEQRVATPLQVLDGRDIQTAVRQIADLVEEWEVVILVVGMPLHLKGTAGAAAAAVERQIAALGATLDTPIFTYDERLTTVTAHRSLDEQQVSSRNRKDMVDMVAAAVILQGWMEQKTND
ncbi:MAG: Holliday junction resolvase RuvX [Acidimicrobiales bacterium]|nr:Holliday junction resolvase RuvX [Acidimicrobiales bacterium]RZV48719.1 MAG: Holliday junction resolvase RuvX [Acidimicrobiales bacterium]